MTRLKGVVGFFAPLGVPKGGSSSTIAPLSDNSRIVGIAARMRVSSLTALSNIGTLRSTSTSAVLPSMSQMLSRVRKPVMSYFVRPEPVLDRKRVRSGTGEKGRVDVGGSRSIKKKNQD